MINFPSGNIVLHCIYIYIYIYGVTSFLIFCPISGEYVLLHFTPSANIIGDKTFHYLSWGFRTFLPLLNGKVQSGILVQQFSHSIEIKTDNNSIVDEGKILNT